MILRFTLLLALLLALTTPASATPPHVRRIAVIVGANDPPQGRRPLRFAQDDARQMADVLTRVGHFAPADVHLLLEPSPEGLTRALDDVAQTIRNAHGEETLFLFYYSGHSDGQAVYPHGSAIPLAELRDRIARIDARVRVGILDTCHGGTWTQAKGLTVGPPLDAVDLAAMAAEGTALVASSSGFESAHEAEAVHGSFFTHHFAAGLLGAADRSGDGNVTLEEAFDYAKELTIRDSARYAPMPQHPSFDVQLRGRQGIVLAQVAASPSSLEIAQTRGPLEVIHLSSGITVVEMPAGEQRVRLALPPGKYLVRKLVDGRIYAREVDVPAGGTVTLAEGQLEASGVGALAMKGEGAPLPMVVRTSLPAHWFEIRSALGVSTGPTGSSLYDTSLKSAPLERRFTSESQLTYAITDRLTWAIPVPAFAYRFGDPGGLEVVPRLGITGIGWSTIDGLMLKPDAGVSLRAWISDHQSFIATVAASSWWTTPTQSGQHHAMPPTTLGMETSLGYSWTLRDILSFHVGAAYIGDLRVGGAQDYQVISPDGALVLGSVLSVGHRSLPLVQVHVTPKISIDGYAQWAIHPVGGYVRDRYMVGATVAF